MAKMKSLFILITVMLLVVLTACGQGEDNAGGATEEKQVIKMGTSADFPPFESIDETTGEYIGFDIELAEYIANELGYELEISNMDFGGLISALQSKRVDFVAAGMSATDERKENVDFSVAYHHSGEMFVTAKDSTIKSIEDLAGKKLGVQLGTIQETGAKKIAEDIKGIEIKTLNKAPELIQELKSGRIDAVYLDKTVAEGFIKELDLAGFNDPTTSSPGMAIAFPKGSDLVEDFNRIIEEMKENGELEKLEKKWLEDSE